MFIRNTFQTVLSTLTLVILFLFSIILHTIEFLLYFISNNNHSLFDLPIETASMAEFFTLLFVTLLLFGISYFLMQKKKEYLFFEYFICTSLIVIHLFKLVFYISDLGFDQPHLWYVLRQFIPIIPGGVIIAFSYLKLIDLKFEKSY